MKTQKKPCDKNLHNETIYPLMRRYKNGDYQARQKLFAILWSVIRNYPLRFGHNGTQEYEHFVDTALERLFPALERYDFRKCTAFHHWFLTILRRIWIDSTMRSRFTMGLSPDMHLVADEYSRHWRVEDAQRTLSLSQYFDARTWQLLCLRYPELIEDGEVSAFARLFAEGTRSQALARLLEYARSLAVRRRIQHVDELGGIGFRLARMERMQRRHSVGWQILMRQKERVLIKMHEDLVPIQYRTIVRLTGIPVGSISSAIFRARAKLARLLGRAEANNQKSAKRVA